MTTTASKMIETYASAQSESESLRDTEARALLNCAARMEKVQKESGNMQGYIDAIRHNQQLWTIFQVSLGEADNKLPKELKVTLLNLSRFVDKVSLRAQTEYNPGLLSSLIDINRHIAAGLSVKPKAEAAMTAMHEHYQAVATSA